MALNKAKIFTITSVKGGVGKTTTLINLAGVYSKMGKNVLIIDLDFFSGDVSYLLNLPAQNDIYSLYEDISSNKFNSLDDYILNYNKNIKLLAAPKDPRFARKIDNKVLNLILYKASLRFDVILIDTNHILTDINLFALDYSDQIIYIINNDSVNLKNMKTFVSILSEMGKTNYKIVLNNSGNKKKYYSNFDIKNIINKNIDYVIPSDFYIKNIDKYINQGSILTLDETISDKYKKSMKVFDEIANNLIKESR